MFNEKDTAILRELAFKIKEISCSDLNKKKLAEFARLDRMEHGIPLVFCSPEGSWNELVSMNDCETSDDRLREIELNLRRQLFQAEQICDDTPVGSVFCIGYKIESSGYGVDFKSHKTSDSGSYSWDHPILDISKDIGRLKFREFSVDKQAAADNAGIVNDIFGDLLPPFISCQGAWWSLGICQDAIYLVGLENFMLFMYDDADGIHQLMSWLRDEHIHALEWFEQNEIFTSNGTPLKIKDMTGFSEAQETSVISPEMFSEFVLPYQIDIVKNFKRNHYGCCEPLHDRWEYVRKIPKLYKVSVSPWCDQKLMTDYLKRDYIYNRKPNPAPVCVGFDENAIRKDLRFTLDTASQNLLEIVLKDTHTVENDKTRFKRFVEIAREEIDRI